MQAHAGPALHLQGAVLPCSLARLAFALIDSYSDHTIWSTFSIAFPFVYCQLLLLYYQVCPPPKLQCFWYLNREVWRCLEINGGVANHLLCPSQPTSGKVHSSSFPDLLPDFPVTSPTHSSCTFSSTLSTHHESEDGAISTVAWVTNYSSCLLSSFPASALGLVVSVYHSSESHHNQETRASPFTPHAIQRVPSCTNQCEKLEKKSLVT